MLKRNQFQWQHEAIAAFESLKAVISKTIVLAFPNFTKPFIFKIYASQTGIGAVLMQFNMPIAFLNKALPLRKVGFSTYEKELWALVYAVDKWRTYLLFNHFVIKIDNQSLKFLLEQRVTTLLQQKWRTRLMGFLLCHYLHERCRQ